MEPQTSLQLFNFLPLRATPIGLETNKNKLQLILLENGQIISRTDEAGMRVIKMVYMKERYSFWCNMRMVYYKKVPRSGIFHKQRQQYSADRSSTSGTMFVYQNKHLDNA